MEEEKTMNNYVDKESLIEYVDNAMTLLVADQPDDKLKEFYLMVKGIALDYISIAPTADVKPVVRGEWRLCSPLTDTYECNNCGYQVIDESFRTNFCPSCGVRLL